MVSTTPFEINALCDTCGNTRMTFEPATLSLRCDECGSGRLVRADEAQRGRTVSVDHPWKNHISHLQATRAAARKRVTPLDPEKDKRFEMRLQPDMIVNLNWLIENLGWSKSEIVEYAVEKLRRDMDIENREFTIGAFDDPLRLSDGTE